MARGTEKASLNRYVSATAIALSLCWGTAALAQDDAGQPSQQQVQPDADNSPVVLPTRKDGKASQKSDTQTPPDIVVTGTNISGVKPVGSETIALDRDQILATGRSDVAAVLQTVPQVQNNPNAGGQVFRQGGTSSYGSSAGGGVNSTQGTAINLRGAGTAATLTLVDGRRVVPSGASNAFTEAIQVPIAALERVEIVTDGNSAIYGSDAISGVVNYILRKNFNGVEVSGRDTYDRYYNEVGGSITVGKTWGSGNAILTYDYDHRSAMRQSQSPYLRSDLTRFGLPDRRAFNGTVAAAGPTLIVGGQNGAPYSYYTIPDGAGAGLSFASLTPGANVLEPTDYDDYLGRQTRHQVAAFVNQDLTPNLSLFFEGFFTDRQTRSRAYDNSNLGNSITVCQGSPYYIADAPAAASASNSRCPGNGLAQTVAVPALTFLNGRSVTDNPDRTYTLTGGAKWQMPASWNAEAYVTYGHDKTCGICNYDNNANFAALAVEVLNGNINPYSAGPLTDAQYSTFMGANLQFAWNEFVDTKLKLDGPLFSLPGGDLRAAVGGEYSWNRQALLNESNTAFPEDPANNTFAVTNATAVHRTVKSLFAELYIPLVGDGMNVPLVQSFNVDAAVRYDKYSDFGSTTNPKVGATWIVNDDLSIRGSWGTAFRAPALTDTNVNNFSAALIGIPFANNIPSIPDLFPGFTSAYQIIGANPDLRPETATTWSAGFDFHPRSVPGLKFSTTYYSLTYKNQIVGPPTGLFLTNQANYDLYSKYIIPVSNPAGCVNGDASTYDPVLASFIAAHPALYRVPIVGACSVNVIIDGRATNAATTFQDGLDFQLFYNIRTGSSTVTLGGSLTKILDDKLTQVKGGATSSVLNTFNYPVSWRGRGQIGWSDGKAAVNLFANYVGAYTNTAPYPAGSDPQRVSPWLTFDLNVNYRFGGAGRGLLDGWRASVNVVNLTNEAPPFFTTSGYAAYDPNNANIFGRYAQFSLTKAF